MYVFHPEQELAYQAVHRAELARAVAASQHTRARRARARAVKLAARAERLAVRAARRALAAPRPAT